MSGRPGRPLLAHTLAFLRSRLLGAVILPAALGAAWAVHHGLASAAAAPLPLPPWLAFLLALAGLAAVELMNLFGSDYVQYLSGRPPGEPEARKGAGRTGRDPLWLRLPPPGPTLPGTPVVDPRLLPPERIPWVLLPLGLAGAAVLLCFVFDVGPGVLAFLLPAAAVGALYVFSPFAYSFLATSLVPPLVSGGLGYILTGRPQAAAFLAGLPVTWISAGVILTYRVAYDANRSKRQAGAAGTDKAAAGRGAAAGTDKAAAGRRAMVDGGNELARRLRLVLTPFAILVLNIVLFLLLGLYPPAAAAAALLPALLFPVWVARLLAAELQDPVPATAVGVLLHCSVTILLALGLLLG